MVEDGDIPAISEGAGTFAEVADRLGLHPTNAERLIVLLNATGLTEVVDGRLRNAEDTERFLVEGLEKRDLALDRRILGLGPTAPPGAPCICAAVSSAPSAPLRARRCRFAHSSYSTTVRRIIFSARATALSRGRR